MAQQIAELAGEPFPYERTSLKNILLQSVSRHGDSTAVVALQQPADLLPTVSRGDGTATYLRWTYSELFAGARLLAAALRQQGVQKGDPIAAVLYNCAEWALGFWASVMLDCPWVVIHPRVASHADELSRMLDLSKPKVLLACDSSLVEKMHASAPKQMEALPTRISCGATDSMRDDCLPLWRILDNDLAPFEVYPDGPVSVTDELRLVLFTSGTTGHPKACMHTNKTLTSMIQNHANNLHLDDKSVAVSHLTLTHCFGMLYSTSFWYAGGTVVYPSSTFDATSTLDAIRLEHCTHMPAVPSLLYSLVDAMGNAGVKPSTLCHIELSGATIPREAIELAENRLGACKTTVHYGLTENGPAVSWRHGRAPETFDNGPVSAGLPLPGSSVRICVPGSRTPVSRGDAGEIHISGPQLIRGYIGAEQNDRFYDDALGHWMMTGDQGVLLSNGELLVSGRYKDIIVRGGENIAPTQIEAILNCRKGVNVQVVGAPDDIVGEVPVAVVQSDLSDTQAEFVKSLPNIVIQQLGPTFALDQVIALQDLGLQDFPQTTSGKTNKVALAAAVREYRDQESFSFDPETNLTRVDSTEMLDTRAVMQALVVDVWSQILGIAKQDLMPHTSVTTLADSLTMMQARRLFRKAHGLEISLPQILQNPTIDGQAEFLSKAKEPQAGKLTPMSSRVEAPSAFDMIEACGDLIKAQQIQQYATPVLARYGLDWHRDVEDVVPTFDVLANMVTARRRLRSSLRRDAFWVPGISFEQMTSVLQRALAAHSVLRSLWFPSSANSVSMLTVRPTERCWNTFIDTSGHVVDTPEQLSSIWSGDPKRDLCDAQKGPGALFRAVVFRIRSQPEASGFIYSSNHAAFDATSLSYFWETIESLLSAKEVIPRVNYKLWADSLYLGRNGPYAQAGAAYFGKKLKGFAEYEQSMVPRPKAPCFLEGDDFGWVDPSTGKLGERGMRVPLDGVDGMAIANRGLTKVINLPNLRHLQEKYGIAAHTVLKASLALANTDWTGTSTAFFRSLQSGRQWPFMDTALASLLPSAVDVDGPTLQASFNVVHFDDGTETVGNLLQRLKSEQELATRYEHTPLSLALANLSVTDRSALLERGLSQLFNWRPSSKHMELQKLRQVQSEMNADTGLHWDFTYLDMQSVEVYVRWDGCQLRKNEVEDMLHDIEKVAKWITQPACWETKLSERTIDPSYRVGHETDELAHAARSMALSG